MLNLRSTRDSNQLAAGLVRGFEGVLLASLLVLLSSCGGQSASSSSSSSSGSGSNPDPPADTPATITSQPKSVEVTYGQPATFTVKATGTAPLTYQWLQNDVDIQDATDSSYTTPATTGADNGAKFTVTVKNSVGDATSKPANLTVVAPVIGGPSHAVFSQFALLDGLSGNGPPGTVSAQFSEPVAAGFLLACGIGFPSYVSSINPSSFTDNDDDSFHLVASELIATDFDGGGAQEAWCVEAPTLGGKNFLVQALTLQGGSLGPPAVFSYANSPGYILQQTTSSGSVPQSTQTLFDSGSLAPTSSGQLAVGVAFVLDMNTAAGNGWNSRHAEENMILEDAETGTGVETATFYSTWTDLPYDTSPYVTFLFLIQ